MSRPCGRREAAAAAHEHVALEGQLQQLQLLSFVSTINICRI